MPEIPNPDPQSRAARRWRRTSAAVVATFVASLASGALASAPALADAPTSPPPVTILTEGNVGHGDFFVSPFGGTDKYANGPEILDQQGNVVWFQAVPAGQEAADFRTQAYRGQPVLTWWQGTGLGGLAKGTDYIYDSHYRQIATVSAGNGYSADGHEFLITPQNTALVLAYATATADLSGIGGPPDQTVIDGIVQEIDIPTGKVLFQWKASDHVPYSQSEQPLPPSASTPWDWFHINAVHLDTDGNLLIDARDTWTTYKVARHSGNVIWQLGGKASSFTPQAAPGQKLDKAGELFAWQHDPEALGNDVYTVFDNEAAGVANTGVDPTAELGLSRAVRFKLDERAHTATLLQSYNEPDALTAPSQGNAQTTADGNLLVGWGSLPYFSEYDSAGDLLFNAEFPAGVNSYRAYLQAWTPGAGGSGPGGQGGPWHGHHPKGRDEGRDGGAARVEHRQLRVHRHRRA
jgi:Arylsulfotransferase (ASST)